MSRCRRSGRTSRPARRELQWVVNAYLLPLSALLLLGGAAGDRFGRRRVFLGGIAGFAAASLACALAPTLEVPARRALRPGRGGGDAAAEQPGAARLGLFGRRARARRSAPGPRHDDHRGDRPAGRRMADRDRRLAGDLLHQPPAGRRGAGARPDAACPTAKPKARSGSTGGASASPRWRSAR